MRGNKLLWAILVAVVAGILCGWFFGREMRALGWLGELFLNALQMTIIPLIVASIISGIAALGDVRRLGRMGGLTLAYFLASTAVAVLTGLIFVNLLEPGEGIGVPGENTSADAYSRTAAGVSEIIRSLVSPNLIAAAADSQLLPILIFCLLFGSALTTIGERGRALTAFFEGLNDVMMKLVIWIMYFAPVGIFALIAARLGEAGGGAEFGRAVSAVGLFVFTVMIGLLAHSVVLFAVLSLSANRGWQFLGGMLRALVTAFGTASSTATLPLTLECVTEAGVDPRAVKFVVPLGAAINKNGTALFQGVAVMFIAQAYGVDLPVSQQAVVLIMATLAAVATAGIPEAGLITMVIVLTAVDLPLDGIGLLLTVDWFLDRLRTTVNVWDDCVGAAVIGRLALGSQARAPAVPVAGSG
ncbi:MAG: dicarboxylate/amino acid:cation symporter [Gammaproteobacteria bacterium]